MPLHSHWILIYSKLPCSYLVEERLTVLGYEGRPPRLLDEMRDEMGDGIVETKQK